MATGLVWLMERLEFMDSFIVNRNKCRSGASFTQLKGCEVQSDLDLIRLLFASNWNKLVFVGCAD